MAEINFGFSLSEESVRKAKYFIEDYSSRIFEIFYNFQNDIETNLSSANYEKLNFFHVVRRRIDHWF